MYILEDVIQFKEFVLNGLPKIITGEEFVSEGEKEAVAYFISTNGVPLWSPEMAEAVEGATDIASAQEAVLMCMDQCIRNIFSGKYGI